MRFVATADWQLGMTAHYLGAEARPRYAEARLEAVRRIGAVAAEHDAELVVVAGDVFESNLLDRTILLRAFEALRTFTVPVYLLPGNHDPLDAGSIYTSELFRSQCPPHVHVLDRSGVHEVAPGVELVAAPWPNKNPRVDLVAASIVDLAPPEGVLRILVGHGATDSLNPDATSLATIVEAGLTSALGDSRLHFVVLGDRHSTFEVTDRVWYPGTSEVTARRENAPGNVLVVDLTPTGAQVTPVHVGRWRYLVHRAPLDSDADIDALQAALEAMPDKHRTALWLVLEGTLTVTQKARLDVLLGDQGALFARLGSWERHEDLHVVPDDADFADLGLTGFADDAVSELRALAGADGDADAAEVARNALALLVRLSGAPT
ncbi:metallophosphoesterase [Aeromicrobium sp.]|uniref:metallophosphoesterase family protein n=1 Tax=Aeromicrobium sp. TaxID=1871063 RepID=UPI001995487A|nr:metallophosphoesterase [Aeromicrobium sp.]MBC7630393.1 metallophosphoesterase [Aeromicrobium sp.]